jgi:hypothetical protein
MIQELEINAAMEGDVYKKTFYLEQCRSIWVPQNWTWYFVAFVSLVTIEVPLFLVLLGILLAVEVCHRVENVLYDFDEDMVADRSCYAGLYKAVAVAIILFIRFVSECDSVLLQLAVCGLLLLSSFGRAVGACSG